MDAKDFKKKAMDTKVNVSIMRGLVITEAVNIDAHIGSIITNYFILSDKHSKFSTMVLSDPYFSFGLKINVLKKIINEIGWKNYNHFKEDLYRINELRNIFAHSLMYGVDGDLIFQKGEKPIETKKAKEMYDEFMSLYAKIVEDLDNLFWHIIGKPNPFKKPQDPEKSV